MSGRSFRGDIYIGFYNSSGDFTGFLPDILNVDELSFQAPETETQARISHKRQTDGQTLDSYSETTGASTMTLRTDEQIPQIMAITLLGDVVDLDISSGSVTAESVTVYHDRWTKLDNINLTGTPTVEPDGGGTAFTAGTDYEIDTRKGMIRALSGGSISDGTAVQVDYDFDAITGYTIVGQTNQEVRARIYGDMEDRVSGVRGEIDVKEVKFRPSEAANLMLPEGFLEAALEGTVVTREDLGETGPFTFRQIG
jgi:hypothetical protein